MHRPGRLETSARPIGTVENIVPAIALKGDQADPFAAAAAAAAAAAEEEEEGRRRLPEGFTSNSYPCFLPEDWSSFSPWQETSERFRPFSCIGVSSSCLVSVKGTVQGFPNDFILKRAPNLHYPLKPTSSNFVPGAMAKDYPGPANFYQLESRRQRLIWILAISSLCAIFYVIGAWQNSSIPKPNPSNISKVRCDGISDSTASSKNRLHGATSLQSNANLDFNAHHQLDLKNTSPSMENFQLVP
ncbi:hypothetical protein KFK09_008050 [Dendrobium nobile]|uniref:Uncharacterized protein n=1 Tax=Dendrobium nobile TaxID=94219 RepID=A0A8T3BYV5_DENNO|nr:hypothetical protein KFK09_008050 [Dendrobium nobile]